MISNHQAVSQLLEEEYFNRRKVHDATNHIERLPGYHYSWTHKSTCVPLYQHNIQPSSPNSGDAAYQVKRPAKRQGQLCKLVFLLNQLCKLITLNKNHNWGYSIRKWSHIVNKAKICRNILGRNWGSLCLRYESDNLKLYSFVYLSSCGTPLLLSYFFSPQLVS